MDALPKVFETILAVLAMIKDFFAKLFSQEDAGSEGDTNADA